MVELLTMFLLLTSFLAVVSRPWIPVAVYSIVSLLQPQHVWPWAYEGYSVFKISAGLAIASWLLQAAKGKVAWKVYCTPHFIGMSILFGIYYLSSWLSPFQNYSAGTGSDIVVGTFTTIYIMYFIALGLVTTKTAVNVLALALICSGVYYAYWANDHYFSENWSQFSLGRLRGPQTGPYKDENALSVLLVICYAFLLFGTTVLKNLAMRVTVLCTAALVIHAAILFASRGALLGLVSVTVYFAATSRSKLLGSIIVAVFALAIVAQGSTLTKRTTSTVAQANDAYTEQPLNARLVSWSIGIDLIKLYPILGAGPQRFQHASIIHFPDRALHVAHNTFLNFAANTGLFSGIVYLSFFYFSYRQYRIISRQDHLDKFGHYINRSCMGALVGFFVCSIFLDLIIFEPFYFLILLANANYSVVAPRLPPINEKLQQ